MKKYGQIQNALFGSQIHYIFLTWKEISSDFNVSNFDGKYFYEETIQDMKWMGIQKSGKCQDVVEIQIFVGYCLGPSFS